MAEQAVTEVTADGPPERSKEDTSSGAADNARDVGDHHNLGVDYDTELEKLQDDFKEWVKSTGFEAPRNLTREAEAVSAKWRREQGLPESVPDLSENFLRPAIGSQSQPAYLREINLLPKVDPRSTDFMKLAIVATDRGWRVTGMIDGRKAHGEFSFHYDGRAIDVSVKGKTRSEIDAFIADMNGFGVRVHDETLAKNVTARTTGPHLHLDTGTRHEVRERIAQPKGARRVDLGLSDDWPGTMRGRP